MLISTGVLLLVFLLITATALERAYYRSAHTALEEQLWSQLYVLLAAADVSATGKLSMPARLMETRFSLPSSGLYAHVIDAQGTLLWKSLSTLSVRIPSPIQLPPGEQQFRHETLSHDDFYILSYGIQWSLADTAIPLTFNIALDLNSFNKQIRNYRTTLWGWLGGMAILLLISLLLTLRWGLRPLQQVARELAKIHRGQSRKIAGDYPREIQGLTSNLNTLLEHQQQQQNRYRDALADLAHSLKTPLAVMRGNLASQNSAAENLEQIERMDKIIGYQLQRASTAGPSLSQQHIQILQLIEKISHALGKVYRDKNIHFELDIPSDTRLRMDEGDFMEFMGNLLDNAAKWCRQQVRISVVSHDRTIEISVEDDGPGVQPEARAAVLQRGQRADSTTPGQGIGLAVVMDIVRAYAGHLSIRDSRLGGARLTIALNVQQ
ncbi:MAG: ATP-binding protein [Gammaproteobacteria bacterium]